MVCEGIIALPVAIGTPPAQAKLMLDCVVVRVPSAYNAILGLTTLDQLKAVVSTYHMKMKFPTEHDIGEVKDLRDETKVEKGKPAEDLLDIELYPGIDILGPFLMATGQRRFVIVAIDYFMKCTEVEPLATITEAKCEEFFWKNVVCRFGIPKVLITDNGKQFDNSKFRSFCEDLSINLRFTSVAHPQSNGQTILKRKLDEVKEAWVDETPQSTLGIQHDTPFLENKANLQGNLDLLDDVRAQAPDRVISTKQRVARYYNRRVRTKLFRVGDLVLRKLEVSDPKAAIGKLSPNWEVPYRILKVLRPGAYSLETLSGDPIPQTWNVENLWRYYQ
ncbi:hypothetical protein RJ639_000767 [Escallonia herrerae]|uniref:Integrase catalytic domain-containing protein n=1 Tax=Escallonia herrerae TaxID=1293975 RepID=A0AA88XDT2_9ASTE|nr:hypothetical protein RJ639_000767 [Escallonia herrerae]